MLKIKLSRAGKKGFSHYRIVVAEGKSKRGGRCVADLGYYSSQTRPPQLRLDRNGLKLWLKRGARPTATLNRLIKKDVTTA